MQQKQRYPVTLFNLLRAVYWYDEALQAGLREAGWPPVTRTQSMLFANIALGETRPARLAANLGVTRQSMSQMIAALVERDILVTSPDPGDRRALRVGFHPDSKPLRRAAETVLRNLHQALEVQLGPQRLAALDEALAFDWGPVPGVEPASPAPRAAPGARRRALAKPAFPVP